EIFGDIQDGNQIAGVDDTGQGYLEEAFDQDYEPEDEDEHDFNLRGQFDDLDDSKRAELLADADNDVDDVPELTVRFLGDYDYESDDNNSGDEGNEEVELVVADLDHHQENVNRGTNDTGSLVTDLEDLQEPPEEEIVFEPETPQVAKNKLKSGICTKEIKAKRFGDDGKGAVDRVRCS
ncbi:unnamed protein product, partial [Cylindrotheca closterium]